MLKLLKGTKLYSILSGSCPVCHNESMYTNNNPYKLASVVDMNERCTTCNTKYKIEPSFFFGAMYVSYPVGIFFAGATFLIAFFVIGMDLIPTYIAIVIVMILCLPIILRLSRNIWINFFMHYKKGLNVPNS